MQKKISSCPKNKQNLKATASSKNDKQVRKTTVTTSTGKAATDGKDTVVSKTKSIKVGTSPFDFSWLWTFMAMTSNP